MGSMTCQLHLAEKASGSDLSIRLGGKSTGTTRGSSSFEIATYGRTDTGPASCHLLAKLFCLNCIGLIGGEASECTPGKNSVANRSVQICSGQGLKYAACQRGSEMFKVVDVPCLEAMCSVRIHAWMQSKAPQGSWNIDRSLPLLS